MDAQSFETLFIVILSPCDNSDIVELLAEGPDFTSSISEVTYMTVCDWTKKLVKRNISNKENLVHGMNGRGM